MIKITAADLSMRQISESGQCFRLNQIGEERYGLVALGRYLEIEQRGEELLFSCTQEEYDAVWRQYFDMENDYRLYRNAVQAEDTYLLEAVTFGSGIRILRQDVWEMLISFIISQQNNIKRIRKCIETICERYGEKIVPEDADHIDDFVNSGDSVNPDRPASYYTFPDVQALARVSEEELRACNLGYRSKYIVETSNSILRGEVDLEAIKKMGYKQARGELTKLCGVGEKVADCICLFGLHYMDAFPVDTHIRKAMDEHYPSGFPFDRYDGYAGVMQQYIFYYDLKNGMSVVK